MIQENLDIFFNDFSVVAVVNNAEIPVIFDEYNYLMSIGTEGKMFTVTTKSSDVVGVHHQNLLSVNNKSYEVVGIRPVMDGQITELDLKEL